MKTLLSLLLFSLITYSATAQSPQKFSCQSVIRNAGNQLVANQSVGIKISVLQGSANGAVVYTETHNPLTNANGLATLEIGGGTVLSGNFANINWANGPYFVKTETDLSGGSNYTITNTTQLMSVPYALYAATAGNNTPGPQGPAGPQGATGPQGPAGQNGTNGQNGLSAYQIWLNAGNSGSEVDFLASLQGPSGNPASDDQNLSVSATGDTLFLQNGGFVIIPGISAANTGGGGQTGITAHSCGATNVHNPDKTYGSMTDQQGNVYKTIVIGTQEWMAENLKTTIYRNGNSIANVTDNAQWGGLTTGAWCYYNNDNQYDCPYGKLYNWYAVADPRNVCPTGWHVPIDAEWSVLINYLDPNADGGNNYPNVAGGKLKSTGLQYWLSPNQDASNESGFSGLPAGNRGGGPFGNVGDVGFWWSSTESDTGDAWDRALGYSDGGAGRSNVVKEAGFSVRCLRD
ncbi:MAG: FISUMP domain-containing protein [Bacteroidia bacterium]